MVLANLNHAPFWQLLRFKGGKFSPFPPEHLPHKQLISALGVYDMHATRAESEGKPVDKKLKMELIGLWASIWVFGMITAEAGAFQSQSFVSFLALIFGDALAAAAIVMRVSTIIRLVTTKGTE